MKYYDLGVEYSEYMNFRDKKLTCHVMDYGTHAFVSCQREDILQDFSGSFKFLMPSKTIDPEQYIRNPIKRDEFKELVKLIASRLH